jgi:hypothetical protein
MPQGTLEANSVTEVLCCERSQQENPCRCICIHAATQRQDWSFMRAAAWNSDLSSKIAAEIDLGLSGTNIWFGLSYAGDGRAISKQRPGIRSSSNCSIARSRSHLWISLACGGFFCGVWQSGVSPRPPLGILVPASFGDLQGIGVECTGS